MTIKYQAMHQAQSLLISETLLHSRIGTPQPTEKAAKELAWFQACRMYPLRPDLRRKHFDQCYVAKVEVEDVAVLEDA